MRPWLGPAGVPIGPEGLARTLELRLQDPVVLLAEVPLALIDRFAHNIAHLQWSGRGRGAEGERPRRSGASWNVRLTGLNSDAPGRLRTALRPCGGLFADAGQPRGPPSTWASGDSL